MADQTLISDFEQKLRFQLDDNAGAAIVDYSFIDRLVMLIGTVEIDSAVNPAWVDWSGDRIVIDIAAAGLKPGTYAGRLTVYDAINPAGLVWLDRRAVVIEDLDSALFSPAHVVEQLRALLKTAGYVADTALTDHDLWQKLRAAEAEASRRLRVFFQPTYVLPFEAEQSELDALEAAGTPYMQEAAYDYDPEFFQGERWGYIRTTQKPLISVDSIRFAYPAPTQSVFDVPANWIRVDKEYGHIRLVPAAQSFNAPLNAYIMQALGGGRTIPFMIQVRYTAGLTDVDIHYPDLIDTVKKLAVYSVLQSAFLPSSGSISEDGLSESSSVDFDKWADAIDHKFDILRDAIHGIRLEVV